jgi:hypothetical protein
MPGGLLRLILYKCFFLLFLGTRSHIQCTNEIRCVNLRTISMNLVWIGTTNWLMNFCFYAQFIYMFCLVNSSVLPMTCVLLPAIGTWLDHAGTGVDPCVMNSDGHPCGSNDLFIMWLSRIIYLLRDNLFTCTRVTITTNLITSLFQHFKALIMFGKINQLPLEYFLNYYRTWSTPGVIFENK